MGIIFNETPSSTTLQNGHRVDIWEYYGDGEGIALRIYDAQGALVKSGNVLSGEAESTSITATADGGFLVAWSKESGSTSSIQLQRFDSSGSKVGKQISVASDTKHFLENATITEIDASGAYVVSWLADKDDDYGDDAAASSDLYLRAFSKDGKTLGTAVQITNGGEGDFVSEQAMHVDEDGQITVTWSQKVPGENSYNTTLHAQVVDVVAGKLQAVSGPQKFVDVQQSNTPHHSMVKIEGGYLLLKTSYPAEYGKDGVLEAIRFDESFNETSRTELNDSAGMTAAATLADGTVLVVWAQQDNFSSPFTLVSQRVAADGTALGEPERVEGSDGVAYWNYNDDGDKRPGIPASIAVTDNGYVLSWRTEFSEYGNEVFSQQFGYDGEPSGPLIDLLNNITLYPQLGEGESAVQLDGPMADYSFSKDADGNLLISSPDGTFSVAGTIRELEFADGELSLNNGRQTLESGNRFASDPASALLADGNQVYVWQQAGGEPTYASPGVRIQLHSPEGNLLLDIEPNDFANSGYNVDPSVASLGKGFVVTWTTYDNEATLFARRYDADGAVIGEDIVVAQTSGGDLEDSNVTQVGDGFAVVWTNEIYPSDQPENPDDWYLESAASYVRLFDAQGNPKGPAILIDSPDLPPYTFAVEPIIAPLDNGFAVVWERDFDSPEEGDGNVDLYIQGFNAEGTANGQPLRVNTITKGDQFDADITRLDNGTLVVAWVSMTYNRDDDPVSGDVYIRRFNADGTALDKKEIKVNSTKDIHGEPSITALTGGGFVVTWATSEEVERNSDHVLYAQLFDANGKKVGGEIIVARDDSNLYPEVNATADGGFTIVWEESESPDFFSGMDDPYMGFSQIHSQRFDANGQPVGIQLLGDDQDNLIRWTGTGTVVLDGGDGDDELYGNAAADTLNGGAGDDLLDGRAGADLMQGGTGDDRYVVDNLKDSVVEQADGGIDSVFSSVSWTLGDHIEHLTLTGSAALNGTGNAQDNQLIGNAGKNTLNGGAGDDWLDGGAGIDSLIGGLGDDTYFVDLISKGVGSKAKASLEDKVSEKAGQGYDTLVLRGEFANDYQGSLKMTLTANFEVLDASATGSLALDLAGTKLADELIGNNGNNVLNGGAGNDVLRAGDGGVNVLIGGAGADRMFAGDGQDTFRFASLKDLGLGAAQDVIEGFTSGTDKLDFKALKKYELLGPDANFTKAKQLSWAVDGDDVVVYINSNNDAAAEYSVRLVGISELSVDDFMLI